MLFQDTATATGIVVKPTVYNNFRVGITEPQRRVIKALSSGKGNYLIEHERMNGRKVFRCLDAKKNIVGNNFKKVVVQNLVSKGYIIILNRKHFLK